MVSKKRVVVGLSGGVDSSVAAHLLLKQGYEVIGLFFESFEKNPERKWAKMAAKHLEIKLEFFSFSDFFHDEVFNRFLKELSTGKTPIPCVHCNKVFKFGHLLEFAVKKLKADFIATGHYAKNEWNEKTKKFELSIPKDLDNDQTYFLHQLNQKQFSKIIFPLSDLTKPEVREIAKHLDLKNHEKKSSTDVCFIKGDKFEKFLGEHFEKKPGNFIEADTKQIIGQHDGAVFYTFGQRKNLGIGGVKDFKEAPWFVVDKNYQTNEVIVSQDETKLLKPKLIAQNINWIAGSPPKEEFSCTAKIRYRSKLIPCEVKITKNEASVKFQKPLRAITPGQSVVFYDEGVCLGGGEIV